MRAGEQLAKEDLCPTCGNMRLQTPCDEIRRVNKQVDEWITAARAEGYREGYRKAFDECRQEAIRCAAFIIAYDDFLAWTERKLTKLTAEGGGAK